MNKKEKEFHESLIKRNREFSELMNKRFPVKNNYINYPPSKSGVVEIVVYKGKGKSEIIKH